MENPGNTRFQQGAGSSGSGANQDGHMKLLNGVKTRGKRVRVELGNGKKFLASIVASDRFTVTFENLEWVVEEADGTVKMQSDDKSKGFLFFKNVIAYIVYPKT